MLQSSGKWLIIYICVWSVQDACITGTEGNNAVNHYSSDSESALILHGTEGMHVALGVAIGDAHAHTCYTYSIWPLCT